VPSYYWHLPHPNNHASMSMHSNKARHPFSFRLSIMGSLLAGAAVALVLGTTAAIALQAQKSPAPLSPPNPTGRDETFAKAIQPFLKQNCVRCHNEDTAMSGVRVDQLDAASFLEDRHIKLWAAMRHRIEDGTMPPKGIQPQPSAADRRTVAEWIQQNLEIARLRPMPKNGMVRRLTVAQYRNTLRELLLLDDDFTEILPPDAVSKDGFLNNKDTLQLSPLLTETYFEIAEEALNRAIVADTKVKPSIQNFRMDFGSSINKQPYPEQLILGAGSALLNNEDFQVTELTAANKPFAF
jgi:mono/diheme cytochrome c family protein